jgi:hypothetical protein
LAVASLGMGALIVGASSGVCAMPLAGRSALIAAPSAAEQVRIVCEEDGTCHRPPRRRPVARWIYGDNAFFGPGQYSGPGQYFGHPNGHWRWFPFFGF